MITLLTVLAILLTPTVPPEATPTQVCATPTVAPKATKFCKAVIALPSKQFIYKNSAPVRDAAGVMIGFRQEPTLIMVKSWARGFTTIYDVKGNSIGRCPWASADGFSGGRWRCTMNTGGLRRAAIRRGRKPSIYIRLNAKTCAFIPDAGACYGSTKGLCDRVLR